MSSVIARLGGRNQPRTIDERPCRRRYMALEEAQHPLVQELEHGVVRPRQAKEELEAQTIRSWHARPLAVQLD